MCERDTVCVRERCTRGQVSSTRGTEVCVYVCVSPSRVSRAVCFSFHVNNKKSQEWGKQKSVFNKNSTFKRTTGRLKIDQLMNNYRIHSGPNKLRSCLLHHGKARTTTQCITRAHPLSRARVLSLCPLCACVCTHMHPCMCAHAHTHTLHSNYSYSLSFTFASCPLTPSLSLTSAK